MKKIKKELNMKKFNNIKNKSYIIDGKEIWVSRSPALVAVIIAKYKKEKYVLIGKRGPGAADFIDDWNVPCGYLDWNETGYEGICREVYEETGFDLEEPKNIIKSHLKQPFYTHTIPEGRQNVSLSYGLYFKCKKLPELSMEYCEPGEVSEVKWLKISEIDNYKFAFNHSKRIKMYLKLIK